MIILAKDFNLSDNGLRKICKKHDIPMPNAGFWAKVKFGKKTTKIKLPKSKNNPEKLIVIEVVENKVKNIKYNVGSLPQILTNKDLKFKISSQIDNPDKLVVETQNNLHKSFKGFDNPSVDMVSSSRGALGLEVSRSILPRVLRLYDNLIKNCKTLNYSFVADGKNTKIKCNENNSDYVNIFIREKCNAIDQVSKNGWKTRSITPNGKLCVKIGHYSPLEFLDSRKSTLEEQIPNMLAKIDSSIQERKNWRIQSEIKRIEKERQVEIGRKLHLRMEDELSRFVDFYNQAHRWKKYLVLKEYYEMIESESKESGKYEEWLEWAKEKLDWYNPKVNKKDILLDKVDKDTLKLEKFLIRDW
jgi:hypothetical protein